MKQLSDYRKEIDEVDNQILELLNKRMEVVKQVGELKKSNQTAIYRPEREKSILDRLASLNKGILTKDAIEAIYLEIFAVSRNLELPEKIAYLGPEGSYTHQVAESRFGSMGNYLPLSSIEAVFEVLKNKEAKYGVVPIENNTDGAVGVTLDCLKKYDSKIVAEICMDIHHSFATRAASLGEIKKIYSHPQGYNQCRGFLEKHMLLGVEFVPTKSTAHAAQMAHEDKYGAAICSHIAAKIYNLPILFKTIEDNLANKTRFFVLSDFKNSRSSNDKTSIVAKTTNEPGALASLLQSFKEGNINLTKIESRPEKSSGFTFVFFVDFLGHIDDENVQEVINNRKDEIKWIGSYVRGCQ